MKHNLQRNSACRQRGNALIEALISGMCTVLVGAMLLGFIRINMTSLQLTMGQHYADMNSRRPLDNLADCIRKAQAYGTGQACLSTATSSSITIYTDLNGNTARYWLDTSAQPYTIKSTIGGVTQIIGTGVNSLQFTYYLPTGNTPSQGACWRTTANPNAPTTIEMPNIVAVNISLSTTIDSATRTYTTPVRLRNGSRTVSGH